MYAIEYNDRHYLSPDLISALVMTRKLSEDTWETIATPRDGKSMTFVMASHSGDVASEFIKKKMTEYGRPPVIINFVNIGRSPRWN